MAGKMVHVELPAKDSAQAKEFYGALFGWQFQSYGDQDYHMTQFDETSGGAISGGESGSNPVIYFDTDDIDASIAKIRENGGTADDKMPIPHIGWFSQCKDPEGNDFSLFQGDESVAE
jgi:predicted enzyme related to lactoylglutathione lyase